jgi:hypothetical protein
MVVVSVGCRVKVAVLVAVVGVEKAVVNQRRCSGQVLLWRRS